MARSYPTLEIVASYQGTVLDVQHLRPRQTAAPAIVRTLRSMLRGRERWRYTVGEGDAASFAAPPVDLVTPEGFELARVGSGGAAWIRFSAAMSGEIVAGGQRYTLQQWVQRGWAVAEGGAFGTTLPPGARATIHHGEVTFQLAAVESSEVRLGRAELDAPLWGITAGAFVVLGGLLMLAQLAMPGVDELELEGHARSNRFVAYFHQPEQVRERKPQPQPQPQPLETAPTKAEPTVPPLPDLAPQVQPTSTSEPSAPPQRGAGRAPRSRGDAPSMLGPNSMSAAAGMMLRGSGPIEQARTAGILAYVDVDAVVNNPYSNAWNPDTDDRDTWEAMKHQDFMAHAVAGRDLVGKGRGGGPEAADDLATSKPRPVAHEDDGESTSSVFVRVGAAAVRGPRAADTVRGVVVRHVRELRGCFGQGLGRAPKLSSRVTLKLEIDAGGDVTAAAMSGVEDPAVADCIVAAARRWSFGEADRSRRSNVSVPLTLGVK